VTEDFVLKVLVGGALGAVASLYLVAVIAAGVAIGRSRHER